MNLTFEIYNYKQINYLFDFSIDNKQFYKMTPIVSNAMIF